MLGLEPLAVEALCVLPAPTLPPIFATSDPVIDLIYLVELSAYKGEAA